MVEMTEKKSITIAETKKFLEERTKDGDITFEQQTALDYVKRFARLEPKEVEALREQLSELVDDEETIAKICDILPTSEDSVKSLFIKSEKSVDSQVAKQIADICKPVKKSLPTIVKE